MRRLGIVYLLLFEGIIGTIGVAHSLLLTQGTPWEATTWFYIMMWVSSMVILLWSWVRYRERDQFDYDESLTQKKLYFVLVGFGAILFLSSFLVSAYTCSSIWVPQPQMALAIGTLSLSAVINDLLYQLSLVSNSEEVLVLGIMQSLRPWLATVKRIPVGWVPHLAIVLPRVGWGVLHAYVSYTGPLQWILVLSAIVSGCVMSYIAYFKQLNVKSLLAAVMMHFLFNATQVVLSALNLF